jgi:hypothetical protein
MIESEHSLNNHTQVPENPQSVHGWKQEIWPAVYGQDYVNHMESHWGKAPYAISPDDLDPHTAEFLLGPGKLQTVKIAGAEYMQSGDYFVAFGGPCLIPSGDLRQISADWSVSHLVQFIDSTYPRLHQIVEGVGVTNASKIIVILEDDLFLSLLNKKIAMNPEEQETVWHSLQNAGIKITKSLGLWHSLALGHDIEVLPLFTSSIALELKKAVVEMSQIIDEPKFAELERSVVDVTYTGFMQQILAEKGYIKSGDWVLCSEPWDHFLTYDIPGFDRKKALESFFEENPYGAKLNSRMMIAGIPLFLSSPGNKEDKDKPFQDVVHVGNYPEYQNLIHDSQHVLPYPFSGSVPIKIASQLLWQNESLRNSLLYINSYAKTYSEQRKLLNGQLAQKRNQVLFEYEKNTGQPLTKVEINQLSIQMGQSIAKELQVTTMVQIQDALSNISQNTSQMICQLFNWRNSYVAH